MTYRYTYEGTEYTSSSLYPNNGSMGSESQAQGIVSQYPESKNITTYMNIENPNSSFSINESVPLWYRAGPVIGVSIVLYRAYSTVLGIRATEPTSANF